MLGERPVAVRPLGGGSFGRPYAVVLADGRQLFAKVADGSIHGLIASEARSLRRLADTGGVAVAEVVAWTSEVLVTRFVEQARPTRTAAEQLGTDLARTHSVPTPTFGTVELSYLASERLPAGTQAPDWATFHAEARLVPFLARAEVAGGIGGADADAVRRVIDRLAALAGPPEPPALLHGDLWSGNVLWTDGPEGPGVTLIDPAAYGGHRETDLAMLALFGLPHLETVVASYDAAFTLAAGWRDRVALHQVFPLLLHALLFGGSYGAATGDAARRALDTVRRG